MGTNGVSFSLVAGACCWVVPTYAYNSDGTTSTTKLTLNINSTGAKELWDNSSAPAALQQNTSGLRGKYRLLVFYTGSNYHYLT